MILNSLPEVMLATLLDDAARRDRATARRSCLLRILWRERFIPRAGLISRVEAELGPGCFGAQAWEDTFYRDLRVVKRAFTTAGFDLGYSRNPASPGYYLRNQESLHAQVTREIHGSASEVDPAQITIYRRLTAAQRFQQGCSISDTARRAVAYRQRQNLASLTDARELREVDNESKTP